MSTIHWLLLSVLIVLLLVILVGFLKLHRRNRRALLRGARSLIRTLAEHDMDLEALREAHIGHVSHSGVFSEVLSEVLAEPCPGNSDRSAQSYSQYCKSFTTCDKLCDADAGSKLVKDDPEWSDVPLGLGAPGEWVTVQKVKGDLLVLEEGSFVKPKEITLFQWFLYALYVVGENRNNFLLRDYAPDDDGKNRELVPFQAQVWGPHMLKFWGLIRQCWKEQKKAARGLKGGKYGTTLKWVVKMRFVNVNADLEDADAEGLELPDDQDQWNAFLKNDWQAMKTFLTFVHFKDDDPPKALQRSHSHAAL